MSRRGPRGSLVFTEYLLRIFHSLKICSLGLYPNQMGISKALKRISLDLGVDSVWLAGRDLKLLILLRMIRMFAYGGTTLILVMFLSALGFPDASIGLFLTLTLVGGMVISSVLTVLGDRMGVRVTMSVASILMMGAGVAFAVVENYWWLLLASVLGVINPR